MGRRAANLLAASFVFAVTVVHASSSVAGASAGQPEVVTVPAPSHCGAADAAGARVVVDISESNRGFILPGSATMEHLHRSLDEALEVVGASSPIERCVLGDDLDCKRRLSYSSYREPGLYNALNGRLDKALRRPLLEDPRDPPRDMLDPFRAVVLVTDGMESASGPAGAADDPIAACRAGADPWCVRALLRQRVREGYGVWLAAALMKFNGRIFAERGLDKKDWERVRAHLDEAGRRVPYRGTALRLIGSLQQSPKTHLSSYTYEGLRPLLFVVMSCDPALGRRLVDELQQRLEAYHVVEPNDGRFLSAQLAPLTPDQLQLDGLVREGQAAGQVEVERPRRSGAAIHQKIECDAQGKVRLRLRVTRSKRKPGLPPFVQEKVALTEAGHVISEQALLPPNRDGDSFVTELRCLRLSAGTHRADFELQTSLAGGEWPTDAWWHELSAPNTYEMPERAYALDDLAMGTIEAALQRRYAWGTIELDVERK